MRQTELEERWLGHLLAMGRKQITVDTYRKNLRVCMRTLEAGERPMSPYDITPDEFVYLLKNLTQKEEVRRAYMRTVALYCVHYTGQDPMRAANLLFNREQRTRKFITDADFSKLYSNADPTMRMAIILGGMMGLRRAEICSIRDEDIRGGYLTVHGKGHGDGLMARLRVPVLVEEELVRYRMWKSSRPNSHDGYLIQSGKPLHGITPASLGNRFKNLCRKNRIDATVHSLRRYYGTTLYMQSASDVVLTAKLLRHADASTTLRCYVSSCDTREREAISRMNDYVTSVLDDGKRVCAVTSTRDDAQGTAHASSEEGHPTCSRES